MKFIKTFKGATGGNPYPQDFEVGDECPEDLEEAAIVAGVTEIILTDDVPDDVEDDPEFEKPYDLKKQKQVDNVVKMSKAKKQS